MVLYETQREREAERFFSLFAKTTPILQLGEETMSVLHELKLREDGFLESHFHGEITAESMEVFKRNVDPYMDKATAEDPLYFLAFGDVEEFWTQEAKDIFREYFFKNGWRTGAVAVVGALIHTTVPGSRLAARTGLKEAVRFFGGDVEIAIDWLEYKRENRRKG
jgi:hypothetical protein